MRRGSAWTVVAGIVLPMALGCTSAPPTRPGAVVVSDSATLRYRTMGSGADTVLVLHGGPGFDMDYLVEALKPVGRTATLLFYDQRGRGESSLGRDRSRPTLEADLRDLEEMRRHFHLTRVTLIGHHYGAGLAALYAERHPERVERLVLISPLYLRHNYIYELSRILIDSIPQARFWDALSAGRDTSDPRGFCREFWGFSLTPAVVAAPSILRRLAPAMCRDSTWTFRRREAIAGAITVSFGHRWDWRPVLPRVRTPTLVVYGISNAADAPSFEATRDAILLHSTETWAALIPTARLLTLRGPSLFPWLDDGRRFRGAIEAFLEGEWPAEARRIDTPPPSPT